MNETDKYRQTAIMLAAGRGNLQIAKLMLGTKARKDLISKSRATAFDFTNENGYKNITRLL